WCVLENSAASVLHLFPFDQPFSPSCVWPIQVAEPCAAACRKGRGISADTDKSRGSLEKASDVDSGGFDVGDCAAGRRSGPGADAGGFGAFGKGGFGQRIHVEHGVQRKRRFAESRL